MNGIGTVYQAGRDGETPTLLRAFQALHFASTLGSVGLTAKVEGGKEAAKEAVLSASLWGVPYLVSSGIRSLRGSAPVSPGSSSSVTALEEAESAGKSDAPQADPKATGAADQPEGSASVSAGENKAAWESVDNPPPTPEESEADKLIQRHGELLEELKKENLSGEGKTASRELQLKFARLGTDYLKFLYNSSIKDEKVRGELSQRIYPSHKALWIQFEEMGGPWRFPMMWPQFRLYDIVNEINRFAQMSLDEQADNMPMLCDLGGDYGYPARVEETQGIEGFDRTEFDAAGQTLRQLQAQYPESLN